MIHLGVNFDHVATVRQARTACEPDPVMAAHLAGLGGAQGSGLYPAAKQALIPIVVRWQDEVGDRRNGHYLGVSIAWTRSALMSQRDAGVEAARARGLEVFATRDTADVCTLCGTAGAQVLKGTTIGAAGGFGKVDAKAMGKVFAAH